MVTPRKALRLDKESCCQCQSLICFSHHFLYPKLRSLGFGWPMDWGCLYCLLAFSCTKHCLGGSAEIKKQQPPDSFAHFLKLCFFRRAGMLFETDGNNVTVNRFLMFGVIIATQCPRLSKSFQIRNIRNLAQASLVNASGAFCI